MLRQDGTLWINIGDSYANHSKAGTKRQGGSLFQKPSYEKTLTPTRRVPVNCKVKDRIGIPWMLAFALRGDGWYLRDEIIWHKPNPMPESVKDRPTKAHEQIFLLAKSPRYFYDADAISEPSVGAGETRSLGPKSPGNSSRNDGGRTIAISGTRNRRSVWTITPKPCKDAHFAVYPPELPELCILAGTPKGGIVLDPFNGSGTTGIVAVKNGRSYMGIELNAEYVEITKQRVKKEVGIEVSTTVDGKTQTMNQPERATLWQRDDIATTEEQCRSRKRDEFGLAEEVERDEHGRRLIDCVACQRKLLPEAAYGLCYKCYRREKRAQKPKTHMHALGQQKEQVRIIKLYSQMMTAATSLGMDEDDIRQLQMLLQPYLEVVPRLLNTADISFLFEDDSEKSESVNSSQAAA